MPTPSSCASQQVCACAMQVLGLQPYQSRVGRQSWAPSWRTETSRHWEVKVGGHKACLPYVELPTGLLCRNQNKLQSLISRGLASKETARIDTVCWFWWNSQQDRIGLPLRRGCCLRALGIWAGGTGPCLQSASLRREWTCLPKTTVGEAFRGQHTSSNKAPSVPHPRRQNSIHRGMKDFIAKLC